MEDRLVYTIEEVAELLMVSDETILTLIKEGKLKGVKLGPRTFRISKKELERFLDENPITF